MASAPREVDHAMMPDPRANSIIPPYYSINCRCCLSRNFVDDMYATISNSIADSIPYIKRSDCLKRLEIQAESIRPFTVRGHSLSQNERLCRGHKADHPTNRETVRPTIHSRPIFTYPQSIAISPSISASVEEHGDRACPSVSGRLSVSTLESGDVSVSCFHLSRQVVTCHPSLYFHLRRRDPKTIDLLRRRRRTSACHRKQFYAAGAILIMLGISSAIVNVVGIVIHASWTFTGIGIWAGISNIVSGWAAIVSAQHKFNDIGDCLRGLVVCSTVCSGFQIAFGVVGFTVRDIHYSLDMDAPEGTTEVSVVLVVFGCVAMMFNLWLAVLPSCRSVDVSTPAPTMLKT